MSVRKTHFEDTIDIDGDAVPLVVRRHARARRLTLRLNKDGTGAVVTIPKSTPFVEGVEMARRQGAWIKRQLAKRPEGVPFIDGAEIPILGQTLILRHIPTGRGLKRVGDEIHITGRAEHFQRRTTDWLKREAKRECSQRAHSKAHIIGQKVGRITVRDTRSRWGSCGAHGALNFSWRLIFAPEFVFDYVVAHEVAHLVHRDHGPDFWALCADLCENQPQARDWLNAFGRELSKYGDEGKPI